MDCLRPFADPDSTTPYGFLDGDDAAADEDNYTEQRAFRFVEGCTVRVRAYWADDDPALVKALAQLQGAFRHVSSR